MKKISIAILLSGIICLFLTGCGSQSIDPADGAQDSWTNDSAADSSEDSSSETSTLPYDDSICGLGGTVLAWDGAQPDVEKYNVKWRKSKNGEFYLQFVEGVGPGRFENGVYDCFQHSPLGAVMATYFIWSAPQKNDILAGEYTLAEYTDIYKRRFESYSTELTTKTMPTEMIIDDAKRAYESLSSSIKPNVSDGIVGFSVRGYTENTATIGLLIVETDPAVYDLQIRNPDLVYSVTYYLVWENNDWKFDGVGKDGDGYKFRYYKFWVPEIT